MKENNDTPDVVRFRYPVDKRGKLDTKIEHLKETDKKITISSYIKGLIDKDLDNESDTLQYDLNQYEVQIQQNIMTIKKLPGN